MRRRQRGSAIIEFSLTAGLLLTLLGGMVEYGLLFLEYSILHQTTRLAAEHAATTPYDSVNTTPSDSYRQAVANIAVYGKAQPAPEDKPVVPGLSREHITVDVRFENRLPVEVTVGVAAFEIHGLFKNHRFAGKPRLTFPYLGEFAAL